MYPQVPLPRGKHRNITPVRFLAVHIVVAKGSPATTQYPNFTVKTNLTLDTHVVASVNRRHGRTTHTRQGDYCTSIRIASTTVPGVYIPPDLPPADTRKALHSIPSGGRQIILDDFNAHYLACGSRTNREGTTLAGFAVVK